MAQAITNGSCVSLWSSGNICVWAICERGSTLCQI